MQIVNIGLAKRTALFDYWRAQLIKIIKVIGNHVVHNWHNVDVNEDGKIPIPLFCRSLSAITCFVENDTRNCA